MWNKFKTLDPLLFVIPLILMVVSVVLIYTLTINSAGISTALHQGIFGILGLALMILLTFVDYRSLQAWWIWIYAAGIGALLLVMLVGKTSFGAARWINIGIFQFQPSEFFKCIAIIALAAFLSKSNQVLTFRRFVLGILLLAVPTLLILLQPDLGTALVIFFSGIGIFLHGRLRRSQVVMICVGVAVAAVIIILSFKNVAPFTGVLKPYQKDRLASFIDPSRDTTTDSGYHVEQSKIAVGSGGLVGQGLGLGTQSQLNFLPVAQADFIFAALAEAWGIVGSYGIIALYLILIFQILHAARIAKDEFGMLICIGIVCKLIVEILINIGMNVGIMPVTGIPLPLMSYGGTTLITNAILLGIAQSIVIRYKRLTF